MMALLLRNRLRLSQCLVRSTARMMSETRASGEKITSSETANNTDVKEGKEVAPLIPAVAKYGPFVLVDQLKPGQFRKWCTCGLSKNQPWCDGKHRGTGFRPLSFHIAEGYRSFHSFCMCKHTKTPPYCDGSHMRLSRHEVEERQKNCKATHDDNQKICTSCGWVPKC